MGLGTSKRRPRASVKRPWRAPKMETATRAVTPPVMCTTPLPAKSKAPDPNRGASDVTDKNPLWLHTACATTGYTNPDKKTE